MCHVPNAPKTRPADRIARKHWDRYVHRYPFKAFVPIEFDRIASWGGWAMQLRLEAGRKWAFKTRSERDQFIHANREYGARTA